LKINNDQIGYYRVKYEYDMWLQLTKALEANVTSMSTLNRAHLLNDAFSLAEAQQLQYEVPLTLTAYLKDEREYVPWAVVASKLKTMNNLLNGNPLQPKLKVWFFFSISVEIAQKLIIFPTDLRSKPCARRLQLCRLGNGRNSQQ
jgi:hypothetical protein